MSPLTEPVQDKFVLAILDRLSTGGTFGRDEPFQVNRVQKKHVKRFVLHVIEAIITLSITIKKWLSKCSILTISTPIFFKTEVDTGTGLLSMPLKLYDNHFTHVTGASIGFKTYDITSR